MGLFPDLPCSRWSDTLATVHSFDQVVGRCASCHIALTRFCDTVVDRPASADPVTR